MKLLFYCDFWGLAGIGIDPNSTEKSEKETFEEKLGKAIDEYQSLDKVHFKPMLESIEILEKASEQDFDVLFFDWGGLEYKGCGGLINSWERFILEEAEEHPNRYYVAVSEFTQWAFKDASGVYANHPANLFLKLEEAVPYLSELFKTEAPKEWFIYTDVECGQCNTGDNEVA